MKNCNELNDGFITISYHVAFWAAYIFIQSTASFLTVQTMLFACELVMANHDYQLLTI